MGAEKRPIRFKEAVMKIRRPFAVVALLLLAGVPFLAGQGAGPETLIARARAVLQTPNPPERGIAEALGDALDASLLILPQGGYAAEFRSLVGGARKAVDKGGMLSDQIYHDLMQSYRLVTGGSDWTVPAELKAVGEPNKGIELAVEICGRLLDSALAAHKAGRNEDAVRDLLGMVILVVTPIKSQG